MIRRTSRRRGRAAVHPPSFAAALALAAVLFAVPAAASELAPRRPLPKEPVRALPLPATPAPPAATPQYRLIVKFRDEVEARTARGLLVSLGDADLAGVAAVTSRFDLSFEPLIRLPEETLAELEERAAARSGIAQPDLAGILEVQVPGAAPAALEAVGEALQRLPEVEFAYIQTLGVPPPGDISPTTPDLVGYQTYRGPDPGIDVVYAHSVGATGAGVRLSDCEYGWTYGHEDLVDKNLHPEPGQTVHPDVFTNGWDQHGTAVLGETSGVVNAYGVSGMVPDADVYTFPEWTTQEGFRRVTAITNAIAGSSAGDVVLLEMQASGAGGGYGPAELDPAVWTVVKNGTDAGVIVVAAAGNGNQDLDSSDYASYMSRGDSGAIIVGAGTANTNHDKMSFSTYGSRVDLQGWGYGVFTLGYGDFQTYGNDPNQRYTHAFSGTSSATPFVAAAAVALQDFNGKALSPSALRALLVQTGIPQGTGGNIGPFPDLRAALESNGCGDAHEPDGSAGQATAISSPSLQTHGICPAGDEDWVTFSLAQLSAVTLETSGPVGDTRMWLYDAGLAQVEFNDDSGTDLFSFIDRVCGVDALPAGTYYVRVDEYFDDDPIPEYQLAYNRIESCDGSCPVDLTLSNATLTGTQTYRASSTVTLGPSLTVAGTSVRVLAGQRVVIRSGTTIGGSFSATAHPAACTM